MTLLRAARHVTRYLDKHHVTVLKLFAGFGFVCSMLVGISVLLLTMQTWRCGG